VQSGADTVCQSEGGVEGTLRLLVPAGEKIEVSFDLKTLKGGLS
jgi:hypothetical protein